MFCKLSAPAYGYSQVPHLHYHATRAHDDDFIDIVKFSNFAGLTHTLLSLQIHETQSIGTTKYMHNNADHLLYFNPHIQVKFIISETEISFPYMLNKGYSCMYGGIYIVKILSFYESEVLSHCTPSNSMNHEIIIPGGNFSIVIIHYSEYFSPIIILDAEVEPIWRPTFPVNLTVSGNKSAQATILSLTGTEKLSYLQSILLKLRKVQHIYINMQHEDTVIGVNFRTESADSCIYCTVIYDPHFSNIRGRQYDMEVSNKAFQWRDFILSIYINMSSCSTYIICIPLWSISIEAVPNYYYRTVPSSVNSTHYVFLFHFLLVKYHNLQEMHRFPVWYMVHMIKSKPNVIWRVWIETCHTVSYVSIEVPTDNYLSTSVYKWNHRNNSINVYMTINKTVSILFVLDDIITNVKCQNVYCIQFLRHFIYDEETANDIAFLALEQDYFISYNLR